MGLDENDIGIDLEDLVQEGSIGLLTQFLCLMRDGA